MASTVIPAVIPAEQMNNEFTDHADYHRHLST